jgi:predicted RNA-binding protein with RPS1 domain
MEEAIQQPRANMSQYAPRIYTIHIPTDKIRDVIGPGGKVIRGIIEQTGVKIDVDDDGTVHVSSADEAAANKALQIIGDITAVAEVGKTYLGKVVRLVDFGAFVEIFPGTDGLLHISEIAENRVREVRDELKEGDQILVKVLALEGNKIKLSRKAVLREQREKLAKTATTVQPGLPCAIQPVPTQVRGPARSAIVVHRDLAGRHVFPDQVRHAVAIEVRRAHQHPAAGLAGAVQPIPAKYKSRPRSRRSHAR